jgi:hypothetical protein
MLECSVRPATIDDVDTVQRLRKHAWRARYWHPETGVTQQVLDEELAVLPPTKSDLAHFAAMLTRSHRRGRGSSPPRPSGRRSRRPPV